MVTQIHKIVLPTPFDVGDVNVYLLEGDSLTLVDAGVKTEEAWKKFNEELGRIGFAVSDIEQVVLTHHHPDHVGLLDYLDKDIKVIGHQHNEVWITQDNDFLKHYEAFFLEFFTQSGIDPVFLSFLPKLKSTLKYSCHRSLTSTVKEGDFIQGLTGWKVLETPGHAQSHIALYHEQQQLLIGGDVLISHISSNPLIEPPQSKYEERAKSQIQYNDTLRRLLTFPIKRVYTGHGEEVENAHDLIQERLNKQHERAYKVLKLIKEQPRTAFQICTKLFPKVYEKQLGLTMSETIGQLDYLENLGEVKIDSSQQHWVYYA
ncbi:MBL fold metallo-hydrolase [Metabacillus iocasae]|uniref:Glyoxylase-like metal-dependent hydrolase (Beta-lactamase superfamily II) n=1 Tax=Priestia iocasae TaxID=2291674 RepID=A0ABS2QRG3_9BACI|nr:MBL fold metallo-hydrolase [Metabacillus iocasae]MBM7701632.1 glyoxylase-like metal-dependent hydrolase (beta-lactamase superfamily II) [Metabacillus iocasae]